MIKWTIGDVSVTRVVELETVVEYGEKTAFLKQAKPEELKTMPWLYPHFVTEDGALNLSVHALLVDAPASSSSSTPASATTNRGA